MSNGIMLINMYKKSTESNIFFLGWNLFDPWNKRVDIASVLLKSLGFCKHESYLPFLFCIQVMEVLIFAVVQSILRSSCTAVTPVSVILHIT